VACYKAEAFFKERQNVQGRAVDWPQASRIHGDLFGGSIECRSKPIHQTKNQGVLSKGFRFLGARFGDLQADVAE
jgi:hypothetical protein